jgi:hypothetical protein
MEPNCYLILTSEVISLMPQFVKHIEVVYFVHELTLYISFISGGIV